MSGRVTLMCQVHPYKPATFVNFYEGDNDDVQYGKIQPAADPLCDPCAAKELTLDAKLRRTRSTWIAWNARLINPGTAPESDIIAVEMDAIGRLLRGDPQLRAACESAAGTVYERCQRRYSAYGSEWVDEHDLDRNCRHCNGSGWVLRDDARRRLSEAA